ncbi:MAG: class I SAM-dependent methyltransferase, partial [Saprospiraceae bacterium]
MNDSWTDRWNERYSSHDFAYGTSPNLFFKEEITKLPVGTILFPAEGEGRNAVFAASLGWHTVAFDISMEGKNKAMRLAESCNVSIDYQVGLLENMNYYNEQFDVIALI